MTTADAGRVIAGRARGIRLAGPGAGTRPMGDRVKQTLFAILDPDLPGARVLDLYAGSGAAGIEALSRGAAHATFVERDTARSGSSGPTSSGRTSAGRTPGSSPATVRRWLAGSRMRAFDIVIVDPPYDEPAELLAALDALRPHLAAGARVVGEARVRQCATAAGRAASIGARAPLR